VCVCVCVCLDVIQSVRVYARVYNTMCVCVCMYNARRVCAMHLSDSRYGALSCSCGSSGAFLLRFFGAVLIAQLFGFKLFGFKSGPIFGFAFNFPQMDFGFSEGVATLASVATPGGRSGCRTRVLSRR